MIKQICKVPTDEEFKIFFFLNTGMLMNFYTQDILSIE